MPLTLQKLSLLSLSEIYHQFITGLQQTGAIEFIGVVLAIVSVWFSQKANIWEYARA